MLSFSAFIAPQGGTCTPSGGWISNLPAPAWNRKAVACAAAADPANIRGSCLVDETCALPGDLPFSAKACVAWIGDTKTCPDPYTEQHV